MKLRLPWLLPVRPAGVCRHSPPLQGLCSDQRGPWRPAALPGARPGPPGTSPAQELVQVHSRPGLFPRPVCPAHAQPTRVADWTQGTKDRTFRCWQSAMVTRKPTTDTETFEKLHQPLDTGLQSTAKEKAFGGDGHPTSYHENSRGQVQGEVLGRRNGAGKTPAMARKRPAPGDIPRRNLSSRRSSTREQNPGPWEKRCGGPRVQPSVGKPRIHLKVHLPGLQINKLTK